MSNLPLETMKLAADTIRTLSMDAVQRAKGGHPGTPMGLADVGVVLWSQHMKHVPERPQWADRDRFILSCGHASMLIYSLLHLSGYDLPMDEIKALRMWGSKTAGHPEYGHTPGVEMTTGPLGQGIATAVGFALAERHLAEKFNRDGFDIVDHYTWVIASDGDIQEGISHEAGSLAGHFGLGKLIVFYDANDIQIDGSTDKTMSENVGWRYRAYGWNVVEVEDGHDMVAINDAIRHAKFVTNKPSLIIVKTKIGFGSPNKEGTASIHGVPLGDDEIALTKAKLGWEYEPFTVPQAAYDLMQGASAETTADDWNALFGRYYDAHPDLAAEYTRVTNGGLPDNWIDALPKFDAGEKIATRNASGSVLKAIVPLLPEMVGGSADLTGSNKTHVSGMEDVARDNYAGTYIRYGVREHGMAALMNGMALHGGIRPYGGTFLVFADYMKGAMRLSSIMNQPVIYVLTHDSIGLGSDGPTHQPIEHLASIRATPNMWVVRPADANETSTAWKIALERKDGPTVLALTRQKLPVLEQDTSGASRGGYVLSDRDGAKAIIIATGSEVEIAIDAQAQLDAAGIPVRVVSIPCWSLFEAQDDAYKADVLPSNITARVAIEAASPLGWERYTGANGKIVALDHFGGSAPYKELYENFGITADAAVSAVKQLL